MVPPSAQADVFYVLKSGEIRGPFSLDEVRSAVANGELSGRDLIQAEDVPIWQPLARLLADPNEGTVGSALPDWRSLAQFAWARLRHDLEHQALVTGAVCLGIGVLAMVLSRVPVVFWLPWFVAALAAAIALLRRQRAEHALVLLAGVVCLPFLFFVVGPSVSKRPEDPPIAETVTLTEPMPPTSAAPVVTAIPLIEELPAAEPMPVVAVAEPSPVQPIEQPASPTQTAVRISPQPVDLKAAPEPLPPSPPVVMTEPLPEPISKPASAPASEGPGLLQRTVDFFSTLGNKPGEQPPSSMSASVDPVDTGSAIGSVGDFVHQHTGAFVVIKGRDGSGSGFVCRVGSQTFLFTNIHVIAGMQQARFTRLDGTVIAPGAAHAAAGHDVLRFAVTEPQSHPLEAMTDFANNVRIGDDIVVLGNSGGGGVVTNLPGKIVGLGPDRIEVSAEFIPGNSGSPIVHVKTGKVIGVATYLTKRYEEFSSGQAGNPPSASPGPQNTPPQPDTNRPPSAEPPARPKNSEQGAIVVRRFAYRLDSIRTWEPVNWNLFQQESEQIRQISLLTEDVVGFLRALRTRREPSFETETLRRPATQWLASVGQRVSPADRLRATESFLRTLRSMVRSDVTAADARLRYSYFRDELKNEREVRDRLFTAFDVEAKRLASPSERFSR